MIFRAGVGAAVIDARGLVLACERSAPPGAWQLPQGGIDAGEEPDAAVLREVEEETGIAAHHLELLDQHPEWLAYELPPERRTHTTIRGQVHKWYLFRFTGEAGDIDLRRATSDEFRAFRWMRLSVLAEEAISFRRPVYRRLVEHFARYLA